MNLVRIRYFLTFCESMHFTNAARTLGISQPALTKAISQLEQDLGTRLIRREGKFTHLTRNGEVTRDKYATLMSTVEQTEEEVKSMIHGADDLLRIGIVRSMDFKKIAVFLTAFHKSRKSTRFDIVDCHVQQCQDLLLNGHVDCVLTIECDAIRDRFRCVELYKERLGVTTDSTSAKNDIGCYAEPQKQISAITSIDLATGIYEQPVDSARCLANCNQELWIQQLVKAGLGYGVSPLSSDTIQGISVETNPDFDHNRQVYAALPVGRSDTPLFNAFSQFLEQYHWH